MEPYIKLLWSHIYNRTDTLKLLKSALDTERELLKCQLAEFNSTSMKYKTNSRKARDRNEVRQATQELIKTYIKMSNKVLNLMDLSEEEPKKDIQPHGYFFDHDDPYFWK